MSKNCTCPICRHHRGEISDEAFAWYLKGCIETTRNIVNCYETDQKLDEAAKKEDTYISWQSLIRCDVDEDTIMLSDLVKTKFEHPDKALLQPENFVLKETADG